MGLGQIWQSVVLPFAAAAFGGWLTAQFALGRFRKEKMWERKTAAYTSMFEALHDMRVWFDRHWDAEVERRDISEEESRRLAAEYRSARDALLRRIASESWLLPDACIERINHLNATLAERHETFFDEVDSGSAALTSAVTDLKTIVRDDLGLVKRRWFAFPPRSRVASAGASACTTRPK